MTIKLTRLTALGFAPVGRWLLAERGLELDLNSAIADKRDVLYAFTVNGALAYVGNSSVQDVAARIKMKNAGAAKSL